MLKFSNVYSVITAMETRVLKCFVSPFISCYFKNLGDACKLFFEDASYRVALHGSGFDHEWIRVCFCPDEFQSEDNFHMEMDDDGDGRMVFIHQFAVATENKMESENYRVILRLAECSKTGLFYLEVDEKSQELLSDGKAGVSACDATVFEKSRNGTEQLVLSGKLFLDRWKATTGNQFVLIYQLSGFHSSTTSSQVEPFALKTMPAFALDIWPSSASNWSTRSRVWPSEDVVHEAGHQRVYSVPVVSVLLNHQEANDSENYSDLWMLDFGDVEAVLMRHLTEFQSQVFHHFRKTYWQKHPCKHRILFRNLQLKHAFFWALEATSGAAWKKQDVVNCVIEICQTVLSFLEKKHFPHYFMPKFDLLTFDRCGKISCLASCSDQMTIMYAVIDSCQSSPSSVERSATDKMEQYAKDQMECLVKLKLTRLFEQTFSLLFMQLYQRLHSVSTLDESIQRHLGALEFIERQYSSYDHTVPLHNAMQAWVTASLGVKYLVKMKSSSAPIEIDKLRNQAQECLKKSVALAPQSEMCSTALVLFLFLTDQKEEVVLHLKKKLPGNVLTASDPIANEHETAKCGTVPEFSKELARCWIESINNLDFMFSRLERPVLSLLPGIWETVEFLKCHVLGVTSASGCVFTIGSEFLNDIVLILALIAEKRTEEALTVIANQEKKLLEQNETPVANDKELIASFFILAAVYSRISRKEDAMRLLKSSRNIFRNPRNPAQWRILQAYAGRFKRYMGWAAQVLIVGLIAGVFAEYFGWPFRG